WTIESLFGRTQAGRPEHSTITHSGSDGKIRAEDQCSLFDGICAEQRGHIPGRRINGKDRSPTGGWCSGGSFPAVNLEHTVFELDRHRLPGRSHHHEEDDCEPGKGALTTRTFQLMVVRWSSSCWRQAWTQAEAHSNRRPVRCGERSKDS